MSNIEQAFFSAYRPSDHSPGKNAAKHRRPSRQPGSSGFPASSPSSTSVDAEYCDVTWYRLDAPHTSAEAASPPQVQLAAPTPPARPDDSPVTVGYRDPIPTWESNCLIITSSFVTDSNQHSDSAAQSSSPVARIGVVERPVANELPATNSGASAASTTTEKLNRASVSVPTSRVGDHPRANVGHDSKPQRPSVDTSTAVRNPAPVPVQQSVEEPETESEPQEESLSESRPADWKAVWEVDEFVWPGEVERLYDSQRDYFRYAGEKLCDASREGLRVLAVTATREKEGCTTMAICLARAAAAAGARVALMDANLAHPELGYKLGLEFARGWQESLEGAPLSEAAVLSLEDGLTILPLSAAHGLSTLNDAEVSRLFHEAAQSFDLIITDAGTMPAGEANCFEPGEACPLHAALIIRDMRRTSETETLVTASRLKSLGLVAIGIAENFLPPPAQSAAA